MVDASVAVAAVTDDGARGDVARQRLRAEPVAVPHLLAAEVLSGVHGLLLGRKLSVERATQGVAFLRALRLRRHGHEPLLDRSWELRANLTAYDALYVALAERLGCRLLTGDGRAARAPGLRCEVEVLA